MQENFPAGVSLYLEYSGSEVPWCLALTEKGTFALLRKVW